jgi:hypothetical protein
VESNENCFGHGAEEIVSKPVRIIQSCETLHEHSIEIEYAEVSNHAPLLRLCHQLIPNRNTRGMCPLSHLHHFVHLASL